MITVKVKGIDKVQAYLQAVKTGYKNLAARSITEYIIGMEQNSDTGAHAHGLMHYPTYKYVNRYAGFPELGYESSTGKWVPGWASAKQHRYVMAMIKEGKIDPGVPHRTGELQQGWNNRKVSDSKYVIYNRTPYAEYVMGDQGQTRMHNLIGWRKVADVVESNLKGAFRYATAQVKKWIAKQKK